MKQTNTFNPLFFDSLKRAEENHFWFQIRRKWIFDKVKKFIPPPAKILEVGCGTGNVSSFLSQKGYSVTGYEYYTKAINMAWSGFVKVQGDAKKLPFKDNSFDIVGLFDVLEHFEDDIVLLRESVRVIKKTGIIIVMVPAREELWSVFDDQALHKRRYTKKRLNQIFLEMKLPVLLLDYMFMSLYIPMKYMRRNGKRINSYFKINRSTNNILKGLFDVERFISRGLPLPIGTSLMAVAQKVL